MAHASNKGFTLIELAIVLIIIGILLGMGAGLLGTLTKRAKHNESKEIVKAAVESVTSYGASHNKLPATGDFTSAISNPNDAYQKSLFYIVDSNLTDTTIGGICGRKTTNLTVTVCPDLTCASPTSTINDVGYIVLSGDGNYNNQTAGTQAVSSATTIKVFETDYVVDNYATDMNRSEAYDDIVEWVAINELKAKANCGAGTALKIINNSLPDGYGGCTPLSYSATVFAEGGVPYASGGKYRWCRQESTSTGLTFSPSTLNADCLNLAEGSWGQSDSVAISGTSSLTGNASFTFFVRDNNDSSGSDDNIDQRTYVITLNQTTTPSSCTTMDVYSVESAETDYYDSRNDECKDEIDGSEIADGMRTGDYIERYVGNNDVCAGAVQETYTFSQALCDDADGDCWVDFDGSDR